MSKAILKKILELDDGDKKQEGKSRRPSKEIKHIKRLQRQKKKGLTVDQVRKNVKNIPDPVEQNLKFLLAFRKSTINSEMSKMSKQIINRRLKLSEPVKEEIESKTVFTEEDFKQFEKEYSEN